MPNLSAASIHRPVRTAGVGSNAIGGDRIVGVEGVMAGTSAQNWGDRAFDVLMGPRTDARVRVFVLWGALLGSAR